jgi:hypothetical protein
MRPGERDYFCPMCSTAISVPAEREPAVMIHAPKGEPAVRIVTVKGIEVHRCPMPDEPRTVPLR